MAQRGMAFISRHKLATHPLVYTRKPSKTHSDDLGLFFPQTEPLLLEPMLYHVRHLHVFFLTVFMNTQFLETASTRDCRP